MGGSEERHATQSNAQRPEKQRDTMDKDRNNKTINTTHRKHKMENYGGGGERTAVTAAVDLRPLWAGSSRSRPLWTG
eukprot:2189913-Heterocapsa_arctica.AAC.1